MVRSADGGSADDCVYDAGQLLDGTLSDPDPTLGKAGEMQYGQHGIEAELKIIIAYLCIIH